MKQIVRVMVMVAAIAGGGACVRNREEQTAGSSRADTVTVKVVTMHPATFTRYAVYYGRLSPINDVKLVCYSGGRVDRLHAEEGDVVTAGTSLASIDSARAATLLETARLQESIALRNHELAKKHLAEGNASPLAVDQARLALLAAKNNTIDAEKNYRGALAITPLSGVVTYRAISRYQELSPGYPTFSVAQVATMKAEIALIESEALMVRPKSSVELTVSTHPDRTWTGVVHLISHQATASDRTFRAEIQVKNTDQALKAGATARVRIELERRDDALLVPSEIIRSDGIRHTVMVVTAYNSALLRVITPGPQSDSMTVVDDGLAAGDRVIVSGYQLVTDGMAVGVIEQ